MRRSRSSRAARRARRPAGLTVSVERSAGRIVGLRVSGHARFARAGFDIVCAGVSALVQSAAYGVRRLCGAKVRVDDDPSGDYSLSVPRGGNASAQAVLATTVEGLRAIARAYPGYVSVRQRKSGAWTR